MDEVVGGDVLRGRLKSLSSPEDVEERIFMMCLANVWIPSHPPPFLGPFLWLQEI